MTAGGHPDLGELGPELRKLAQAILDKLDPAIRAAALLAASGDGPGKCQQVWCPVCALAALMSGEEHPLLAIVAEHSVALYEVIRSVIGEAGATPSPPEDTPPGGGGGRGDAPAKPSYEHIPVTIATET